MRQPISSVALYCEPKSNGVVSVDWLEGTLDLLQSHGLQVRAYGLGDTPVCDEGMYPFADGSQVMAAVRTNVLRFLELYCHSLERPDPVLRWNPVATISFLSGNAYFGVPASSRVNLPDLLLQGYALTRPLAPWTYGIGYSRLSSKGPSMYAHGFIGGEFPLEDESQLSQDRVSCWANELMAGRRHLTGSLRDVYPANLLSAQHVQARIGNGQTLLTSGWGEFTQLDSEAWLWTVPEADIPHVRAQLQQAGLLLCA